jgi:geranylgeranylglycerol-phosphate geranylgeranyltransferase
MSLTKFIACLSLIRIGNALFAGFACVASFIIAGHSFDITVCQFSMAFICSVAFANAHNDCVDYKIDCINRPNRPLPSGKISYKAALFAACFLLFLSILFGFCVSPYVAVFFVLIGFFSFIYNKFLKRIPLIGNLAVALLTSTPFMISNLFQLIFFSFILTLARELIKDIEDIKGDASFSLKTLPLVCGVRFSLALAFACEASCLLALAFWKPFALFAVTPCIALSVYFALGKKWRHSQTLLKVSMAAGLLCYLI